MKIEPYVRWRDTYRCQMECYRQLMAIRTVCVLGGDVAIRRVGIRLGKIVLGRSVSVPHWSSLIQITKGG